MNNDEGRPDAERYSGIAALSVCESLMLALKDHRILPEKEFAGILQDAAAAHENAPGSDAEKNTHRQIASLINRINLSGRTFHRP